ncbi:FtsX-like permease family protein [Caldimonas sp.]|uniref:ABC transporter permease n=1 Tax=Caldimonas sp. TaxID=2838790 RepID=UPI0029D5598D|nr:FtsX-like permease family protein [Caldimonas manganoxidans]
MLPSVVSLALRQTWRDFRAGELRLLVVAVMLAVAALTAVSFFADRLRSGLQRDAAQLLGGDAIVASDHPTPQAFVERAHAQGLRVARTVTFPSMARAPQARGGATRLVAVKAVSEGYPLRGRVRIAPAPGQADAAAQGGPAQGSVWVDAALLEALQLSVGDMLLLGEAALRIDRVITLEPDRGAGFMAFAPRVMLHEADLAATALIQPASRVTYRLAVAAPPGRESEVARYLAWAHSYLETQGLRGVRLESLDNGRPEMRQTLDRAERFLNLVALLAALLAAVAVGIAARDFASGHLDDCAMLRVLGLPQRAIAWSFALEFGVVGAVASVLGVMVGYAVHHVFVVLLSDLIEATLPAASLWPVIFGLGVGSTLLCAFGLPPVLQLAQVPALRVIRREMGELRPASLSVLVAGALGFAALLVAASSDVRLGLIAVGGFAAAMASFALAGWLAVQLLRRIVVSMQVPRWLRLATRQVAARPGFAVLQVCALAVGLLALVLLVLLRTDLIASWRQATPPDAPNRFVINIQPEQAESFRERLTQAGVQGFDWYPMIRGRLISINGRPVSPEDYTEERARRLVDREFNLSHAADMPRHNVLAAGQWVPEAADEISVEEGLARTLGLRLGDVLVFDVAGMPVQARITSLRRVDWASMRVNFFAMFPRNRMDELPTTYIAAFRAPPQPGFDHALIQEFPNITNVDVSASIAQVQRVLDQVIRAVEFLFGFTLAAGVVVLFAAVVATRQAREREFAVMRAMGAGRRLLSQVQRAELIGVGALAGALAAGAAIAVGWALARYAFEFHWAPSPWVPLAGMGAGAGLALAAGWWGLREVLRRPVVETLRRAAQ